MAKNLSVPAVQYLRMSTEHQQYSLENQSDAIWNFKHGLRQGDVKNLLSRD
jgi:DNA invertase Pin-like site-specific DNA recombinase